jgi:hypothetical protein
MTRAPEYRCYSSDLLTGIESSIAMLQTFTPIELPSGKEFVAGKGYARA